MFQQTIIVVQYVTAVACLGFSFWTGMSSPVNSIALSMTFALLGILMFLAALLAQRELNRPHRTAQFARSETVSLSPVVDPRIDSELGKSKAAKRRFPKGSQHHLRGRVVNKSPWLS